MSWTTPKTYTTADALSAADLNTYERDNLSYLFSGRPLGILRYTGGDKTTSTAPFVAVDATNVKVTTTLSSGRAEISVTCTVAKTTGTITAAVSLGIDVDGTNYPMGDISAFPINSVFLASFSMVVTGLSVGAHVFTLTWGSALDTMTMYGSAARPITIIVKEI